MKIARWTCCVALATLACESPTKGESPGSTVRSAPSASGAPAAPRAKYGRDWLEPPVIASSTPSALPAPPEAPVEVAPGAPVAFGGADEMRAVARARTLLLGDPKGALAALSELARTQPRGYFMEEREALVILALVRSGNRVLARRKAAVFVIAHPRGTLTDQVRAATGL